MTDEKKQEAAHNLSKAHDLLHLVYISGGKNDLSKNNAELKKSIEQLATQIKSNIVDIVSSDGIDLNLDSPRYWDIVNDYINRE